MLALALAVSAGPWLALLKGARSIREYQLSRLMPGQVLAASELTQLLPPDKLEGGHVKFPRFPRLAVRETVAPSPDWLMVSNNPEIVDLRERCLHLYRGRLPAGRGRIFISHFNPHPPPADLLLTLRNLQQTPAHVRFTRQVWFDRLVPDAGTVLFRDYLAAGAGPTVTIAPGETHQEGLRDLLGNGLCLADLNFDFVPKTCRRALVLLVPRAGYLGAVLDGRTYGISPYGALVLARLDVDQPTRWQWVYTLPANSFAPNGILIVPLK